MRRRREPQGPARSLRVVAASLVVGSLLVLVPGAASAESLTGCSGTATSFDADGNQIDQATASDGKIVDADGKPVFTSANPFTVDNQGTVKYSGSSDAVITDHTWKITMFGTQLVSGGSPNASLTKDADGTFDIQKKVSVRFTGLVRVEGDVTGRGGSCAGDGYIEVQGNPFTSPVTWFGLLFAGFGALGLFFSLPRFGTIQGGRS